MGSPWWSVGLWPPSESTRQQHVEQLVSNLSNETYARGVYGVLGKEDAYENAKRIEQKCFDIGDEHFKQRADDGRSALRLYAKEACGMVTQVMEKAPKTAKRKFHWVQETIDILTKIKESHRGTVQREVPTKIVKHGPGHNREPDDAKGIASSLTDSINSCKRICLNNRSSGIGDANVDVARGSTQWMMERLEYVLTKINGNFISNEGVDEVKKILEVVVRLTNDGFDEEAKNDNEECMEDDNGGLDLKMENMEGIEHFKPDEIIEQVDSRTIAVSPLPYNVKLEEVQSFFSQYAKVNSVRLACQVISKLHFCGTAFVEFSEEDEAKKIMENNLVFAGTNLEVRPKKEFDAEYESKKKEYGTHEYHDSGCIGCKKCDAAETACKSAEKSDDDCFIVEDCLVTLEPVIGKAERDHGNKIRNTQEKIKKQGRKGRKERLRE